MYVSQKIFGNSWDSHFQDSSYWKSLNQRLQIIYLFCVCRGQCYDIFLTKDCVALFVSLEKCDFEKNPLKGTLMQI